MTQLQLEYFIYNFSALEAVELIAVKINIDTERMKVAHCRLMAFEKDKQRMELTSNDEIVAVTESYYAKLTRLEVEHITNNFNAERRFARGMITLNEKNNELATLYTKHNDSINSAVARREHAIYVINTNLQVEKDLLQRRLES